MLCGLVVLYSLKRQELGRHLELAQTTSLILLMTIPRLGAGESAVWGCVSALMKRTMWSETDVSCQQSWDSTALEEESPVPTKPSDGCNPNWAGPTIFLSLTLLSQGCSIACDWLYSPTLSLWNRRFLWSPRWSQTQRSSCFCLLSAGMRSMWYTPDSFSFFLYPWRQWVYSRILFSSTILCWFIYQPNISIWSGSHSPLSSKWLFPFFLQIIIYFSMILDIYCLWCT